MHHLHRRQFVSAAAIGALPFAGATPATARTAGEAVCSPGKDRDRHSWIYSKYFRDEIVLGSPTSAVSIVEYLSPGASHCANWHRDAFPEIKKNLIDTGAVRWAIREMAVGPLALCYPTFILARRVSRTDLPGQFDGERYLAVIEAVLKVQYDILVRREIEPFLVTIAKSFGLTEDQYREAVSDWGQIANTVNRCAAAVDVAGIDGVPTFYVADEKLEGDNTSLEMLKAAIARAERS